MFFGVVCLHVFTTFAMTGLIWFVQVVHYPLFQKVDRSRFVEYEQAHTRLTSFVVIPLMVIEILTAILLCIINTFPALSIFFGVGLALNIGIWVYTFVVVVPIHNALCQEYSSDACRRLVRTNWLRTLAWTLRSMGLLWIMHILFS